MAPNIDKIPASAKLKKLYPKRLTEIWKITASSIIPINGPKIIAVGETERIRAHINPAFRKSVFPCHLWLNVMSKTTPKKVRKVPAKGNRRL